MLSPGSLGRLAAYRALAMDALTLASRSRRTISASRLRIAASIARINESTSLLLPVVQGGSGDEAASDAMAERLAALPKEPRKVYAGPASSAKKCDLCAEDIPCGGTEYEVEFTVLTIRLDPKCFTLWWQSKIVKK